eukprot:3091281-Amphidinium_carterae.1
MHTDIAFTSTTSPPHLYDPLSLRTNPAASQENEAKLELRSFGLLKDPRKLPQSNPSPFNGQSVGCC